MKNICKLSLKMLKRNKLLNIYIIIQMAIVFAMTIFRVSSLTSRYHYYLPFKKFIESDGYFCNLTSATTVLGKYVQSSSDISEAVYGAEESNVQASYRVNLSNIHEDNMYALFSYSYDEEIYNNWIPDMQEGNWLSDIKNSGSEEIPVVVYDTTHSMKLGDVLEKQSIDYIEDDQGNGKNEIKKIKLRIAGILSDDAEIVHYNELEYGDCRDIFSTVKDITEREGYETLYLFRSQDIHSADIFCMSSGIAFINTNGNISDELKNENQTIIIGITEDFMELKDFQKNSQKYITDEIKKIMPIFLCILLLTIIITISVNAITTYKEVTNYALYYICGLTWKKAMLISLIHAAFQTLLALFTAIISMLVCYFINIFSNTVLEFYPLQILVCLAMIIMNMIFAFIMPYIIIRNSTPREILTSN